MTVRNLHQALAPNSVAVVGASSRPGAVGKVVLDNILAGGFAGPVYAVNPKYRSIGSMPCYARAADLPEAPELAIIITPPATVPGIVTEFGQRGTKLAVVITAGVGAEDNLRQLMLDAARPHLMRVIGPNTIGLVAPRANLNASFVHLAPSRGRLGLISQSGAMVSSILDWGAATGVGFSQLFSLGDMADVDVGDVLDLLAQDEATSAILIYLESIPSPRKFMSAARAAARLKPVIAVKPGRHEQAARAALTHTGALAGADRVVDAALHRAGIIRVRDLDDLFDAAAVTARFKPMSRSRVAIVTNGGGAGVLAVDQLLDQGCELAELTSETMVRLNRGLPPTWSHANPVDIIGDAPPDRYRTSVEAVAADPQVDALLVMNCPTGLGLPEPAAEAIASIVEHGHVSGKPLLACWLGKQAAEPARKRLEAAGIASFDTPTEAAEAVSLLTRWAALREALQRVPPSTGQVAIDTASINRVLQAAAVDSRTILTEVEAKAVISACGITIPALRLAQNEQEVEAAAGELLRLDEAVVVKLVSRVVTHKSDVGGVVLGLRTPEAAASAARDIARRLSEHIPGATPDGFSVQSMINRPQARELIAGIGNDPIFGPTVLFGAGGTAVEVIDDVATGLVPIDAVLADDLIAATRVGRLLAGYRDVPPADREAIEKALLGLSQLVVDHPAIVSVDINPLLATAEGVIALDARIEIDPALVERQAPNPRLVIRPYPAALAGKIDCPAGRFAVRPIMPTDAALYPAFLARVTAEDMRRRFFSPLKGISPELLVRLTQLDYDRDLALVALERQSGDLAAVARYAADPDHDIAEFGILIRSDLQGRGLGKALMAHLIAAAHKDGLRKLEGVVLSDNPGMLALCRGLGFSLQHQPADPTLMRASLDLSPSVAAA